MKKKSFGALAVVEKLKFVFKCCGLWSVDISPKYVWMYNCYSSINFIVFLVLFDLSICVYIFFVEDIQDATNSPCMSLTVIVLFGKVLNFRYFQQRIKYLLCMVQQFPLENDRESELFDREMLFFNRLISFLYCIANVALLLNFVGSILCEEVRLPYLGWYPIDWKSDSSAYALVYTYQFVCMFIQANLNMSIEVLTAYLMHTASIKLEILGTRLHELSDIKDDDQSNEQNDTIDLIKCIVAYQHIYKFTQDLQKCITYAFLIHITFSGSVICTTAYQLTITSPQYNLAAYTYLILYQLSMIAIIAIPCYFGNEIKLKYGKLIESTFDCGWHLKSIRFQRVVIIFMEIMKRERPILAGNWIVMDLNLFVSIMNFAYRLYTVLA